MRKLAGLTFAIIVTVVIILWIPLIVNAAESAEPAEPTESIIVDQPAPTAPTEEPTVAPPVAPVPGPPATIIVHRVSNICDVYDENGLLIKTLVVSTGREGHRTPLGNYKIYEHSTGSGYHLMVDGTYGRWCMRFKKGGYMFHSVCYAKSGDAAPIQEEVDALGTSVSRGCVRLSVTDAEWLYTATPKGCAVSVLDD